MCASIRSVRSLRSPGVACARLSCITHFLFIDVAKCEMIDTKRNWQIVCYTAINPNALTWRRSVCANEVKPATHRNNWIDLISEHFRKKNGIFHDTHTHAQAHKCSNVLVSLVEYCLEAYFGPLSLHFFRLTRLSEFLWILLGSKPTISVHGEQFGNGKRATLSRSCGVWQLSHFIRRKVIDALLEVVTFRFFQPRHSAPVRSRRAHLP